MPYLNVAAVRKRFPVLQNTITLSNGRVRTPVLLNNGATTPIMAQVAETVEGMSSFYGAVGRGSGPQQQLATQLLESARNYAVRFAGGDPDFHYADFTYNDTYALNILIRGLALGSQDVVIHTIYGHNSTHNPLHNFADQTGAKVIDIDLIPGGTRLDINSMMETIKLAGSRLKAAVLTHASNLTGHILPINDIAEAVHRVNPRAFVIVDAAQTFSHIPIEMGTESDRGRIDMLAATGHKAYCPFGIGLYIAPYEFLSNANQLISGGGTISFVSSITGIDLAKSPARLRAGTPNVVGAVALMRAMQELEKLGLKEGKIAEYELGLKKYFYALVNEKGLPDGLHMFEHGRRNRFKETLGNILIAGADENLEERLANLGIESRYGASCATLLALRLSGITKPRDIKKARDEVLGYSRPHCYSGINLLRLTPAFFNTKEEMRYVLSSLRQAMIKRSIGGFTEKSLNEALIDLGLNVD